MPLVLGVGIGVFILGFVWALAILSCILLARTSLQNAAVGVFFIAAILTVTLIVWPKLPAVPEPEEIKITDQNFWGRLVLQCTMGIFTLASFGIMFSLHWTEPILAKPLKSRRF
ncbi:transmembrane protein 218-like [Anneissia japonica]|uniref:transmembrane protein 218-like n=1 Tax=Anneissia japonica TaxID=1529436 RepID=UPI0014256382|nr:transmembrane protein 218-like [Anneissia japonica]XP_033114464.1 transmembrane protein 218-like [Anneissia japonica]